MALKIRMYSFSKRENSTKQPDNNTAQFEMDCTLKSPCGVISPNVEIRLSLASNPAIYNYAYIPHFNRYYFISEWTWTGALWEAALQVDPLASWRSSIGASSEYILRSSADNNPAIIDTMYPTVSIQTQEDSQIEGDTWAVGEKNGTYIVGVLGGGSSTTGSPFTSYYLFEPTNLHTFIEYLFSDDYANAVIGNWSTVYPELRAQFNPLQYISSVSWLPLDLNESEVSSIRVGYVDVACNAMQMPVNGLVHRQVAFNLRRHPDAAGRGQYLNNAPFASYELYFPPFGLITLDSNSLCIANSVSGLCSIDIRTGEGTLNIFTDNARILGVYHSTVCVPIQLSQVIARGNGITSFIDIGMSAASAVTGAVSGALSGATGGTAGMIAGGVAGAAGGLEGLASGIGNALANNIPVARSIGANGGFDALRGKASLQYTWRRPVEDDNEHRGRPLCETRKISTLPGYLMIADPDITIPGTAEENTAIKQYMISGFYYE